MQSLDWKGDGYCDDSLNNQPCGFDGGDCCIENVMTDFCNDCICHENTTITGTYSGQLLNFIFKCEPYQTDIK